MPRRMWNSADFRSWTAATGLPADQAAVILGISERTIKRLRNDEDISVKDSISLAAQSYLEASRTTKGSDAEQVDSWASQADLADLCTALPYAHLSGITSAIARGWTTDDSGMLRTVAQPPRMPQPLIVGKVRIEWMPGIGLPWGVECREDAAGRPYRIASIERTLLELAEHESIYSIDTVIECYRGAFWDSRQAPNRGLIRRMAGERGAETGEKVAYYLSPAQLE